jgi:hypothetical protein
MLLRVVYAEELWDYRQPFDYIHGRDLAFCFRDPAKVIVQAYNALSPGGVLDVTG